MSIVNGTGENIKAILDMFGVKDKYTKEVYIHIVAGEPVILDIVAYADISENPTLGMKQYYLTEIPNEEEKPIEE